MYGVKNHTVMEEHLGVNQNQSPFSSLYGSQLCPGFYKVKGTHRGIRGRSRIRYTASATCKCNEYYLQENTLLSTRISTTVERFSFVIVHLLSIGIVLL